MRYVVYMSRNGDESTSGTNTFRQWCIEASRRAASIIVEKTENKTITDTTNVADTGGGDSSDYNGSEITTSQVSTIETMDEGDYVQGSGPGGGPFSFLRDMLSDHNERVPDSSSFIDNIYNMSVGGSRDYNSSEEMARVENSKNLGGQHDSELDSDDDTVPSHEEEYEDFVERLGRVLAAEFVSGIHR